MSNIFSGFGSLGSFLGLKKKPTKLEPLPEDTQSLEDIFMLVFTYAVFYRYIKHELKMSNEALEPYKQTFAVLKQELRLRLKLMRHLAIQGVESMKDIPLDQFGIKGVDGNEH